MAIVSPILTLGLAMALIAGVRAQPLIHAHAHNDYRHRRPLLDALENGFCSVEADIFLVNGQLLVAHDLKDARPDRTLEGLYLAPLSERIKRHDGWVYQKDVPFTLLIDIKRDENRVYEALKPLLQKYSAMLTQFQGRTVKAKAITVILSGSRPISRVENESKRWCALDGRISDLDSEQSSELYPLISDSWLSQFSWLGAGSMPTAQRQRLHDLVSKAHRQGKRIRFYGAPDHVGIWTVLNSEGVDLINSDNLSGLRQFLLDHPDRGKF